MRLANHLSSLLIQANSSPKFVVRVSIQEVPGHGAQ
jgi:hypothetical protein